MNSNMRESIVEVCSILSREENLTVAIHESGKGALLTGMGVFIGGIFGGPAGMAVGGTLSSIAVAISAKGKFKSVVEIISEMDERQRNRLAEAVQRAIQNIRPEDCVGLLTLALTSPSVKEAIIKELGSFLMEELNLKMLT